MKKIYVLLLASLLAVGVFAGCDTGAPAIDQSSASASSQEALGQSQQPGSETIPENPENNVYQMRLEPLAKSGLLLTSWSELEGMDTAAVMRYCAYSLGSDVDQYKTADNNLELPATVVEELVSKVFLGNPVDLQKTEVFDSTKGCYVIPAVEDVANEFKVTNVLHTITTEVTLQQTADSTGGRAIIEIDEDLGGRINVCVFQPEIPQQQELAEDAAVNQFLQSLTTMSTLQLFQVANTIQAVPDDQKKPDSAAFASTLDLSADDLFAFYLIHFTRNNTRMQESYNEQDGFYHIPLDEVTKELDKYFEGHVFEPEALLWRQSSYLAETNEILVPVDVYYMPDTNIFFMTEEPVSTGDTTTLTANCYVSNEAYTAGTPVSTYKLTLKIDSYGYRFVSLEVIPIAAQ